MSPFLAEVLAIRQCLQLFKDWNFFDFWIESDCLQAVQILQEGIVDRADGAVGVLEDCIAMSKELRVVAFSHMRRTGNAVVHALAKLAEHTIVEGPQGHVPGPIMELIRLDVMN